MACFSPLDAWQLENGSIVFYERGKILRSLSLPCGQCIGCRLERSRQWAIRCMHEASMHEANSFLTLTYDQDHCPDDCSLRYSDFQLFMRRVRKELGPVRFTCAASMVSGLSALIITLFFLVWIFVSTVIFGVIAAPVFLYIGLQRLRRFGILVRRRSVR